MLPWLQPNSTNNFRSFWCAYLFSSNHCFSSNWWYECRGGGLGLLQVVGWWKYTARFWKTRGVVWGGFVFSPWKPVLDTELLFCWIQGVKGTCNAIIQCNMGMSIHLVDACFASILPWRNGTITWPWNMQNAWWHMQWVCQWFSCCFSGGVAVHVWKGGKDRHPQDFSLTKKTARFTKDQFRPY